MTPPINARIHNVWLDEDGNVELDAVELKDFKYAMYLNVGYSQSVCTIIEPADLEDQIAEFIDSADIDYLAETNQEQNLHTYLAELRTIYAQCGGVLITWALEYDNNISVIYGATNEEITNWLTRLIDDEEFETD